MPAFIAITFGWAWLLWGYWVFAMPPGGVVISAPFLATALAGGLAPSIAGLAVSYWRDGREGVMAPLRSLRHWRVGLPLLLTAALLVPAISLVSILLQGWLVGPLHAPDGAIIGAAMVWPVMAALGEEFGWRGFLLPRLAGTMRLVPAAVLVGLIWGVWHLPADYVGLKGYGDLFWLAFLINGPLVLTGHSMVMAWLWRETGGSLFVSVLYHASITACAMLSPTAGSEGWPGIAAAGTGALVVWGAAVLLFRSPRGESKASERQAVGRR
jgi:membrane protease YdiL (CAAX protease family)